MRLKSEAKKVLSFTDNRQDASLQAGHFNDFVEVAFLRSSLYKAMENAGENGLDFEAWTSIFREPWIYLQRSMLMIRRSGGNTRGHQTCPKGGFKIPDFQDLRRGWRLTSPNLEQCGLLQIQYKWIDDFIQDKDLWEKQNASSFN